MIRTYKPKVCACPCKRTFVPRGPRSLYATPACARRGAEVGRAARRAKELVGTLGPIGAALGDVMVALEGRADPVDLTLPGLGQIVRNVVQGCRAKDRAIYAEALAELGGWALLELSRVRPGDDATAS